jgi:glycine/D-amino acid oxidase-like deaminating enzyme
MHELSNLSLWHDTMSADDWGRGRPALGTDLDVDVAIVGGGYTGLWTAFYLLERQPSLRVAILEANVVGFGASGRNGGWCSALLPMGLDAIAAESSKDAAVRLQSAMHDTVAEVGRVVAAEDIDCHFAHGGYVSMARNQVQWTRARDYIEHLQSYGFSDDDYRLLDRDETLQMVGGTDVVGGYFTPHCAAIHPARLARGLARAVERKAAVIYEHTPVVEITPRRARTNLGVVRADVIVRATEAFTPSLKGLERAVVPIYSLMVATEPLPASFWESVGLAQRQTFNDGRQMVIYGQRTADDRLAFGGRGAPYHFASSMKPEYDRNDDVHRSLHDTLRELFPAIGDAAITHRWGGAVAAARDWWCSASYDAANGLANAGAYVGDGVGTTNLSGRTLADLITGERSALTELPWVGHHSRQWEPEPLRWLGINAIVRVPVRADEYEARHDKPARLRNAFISRITGH